MGTFWSRDSRNLDQIELEKTLLLSLNDSFTSAETSIKLRCPICKYSNLCARHGNINERHVTHRST